MREEMREKMVLSWPLALHIRPGLMPKLLLGLLLLLLPSGLL